MIDAQTLIYAAASVSEVQKEVPYHGPIWWELQHAKSCLLQAHRMITELNERIDDDAQKNREERK